MQNTLTLSLNNLNFLIYNILFSSYSAKDKTIIAEIIRKSDFEIDLEQLLCELIKQRANQVSYIDTYSNIHTGTYR